MSFDKKFKKVLAQHPDYSSLVCFNITLRHCPLKNRALIKEKFLQLVDPDDYDPKDRKQVRELLDDLYNRGMRSNAS